MTKTSSCHLLDMLAEVPDPRKKKGRRHPLVSMLALTILGLLCGQRSSTQIAKWARLHPDLRQTLGFTAKQTPAAATFHYLYRHLDTPAVEKTLTQWTTQTLARLHIPTADLKGLAIDGKTLGNSHPQKARRTHLLAAVCHEIGIPIAECAVSQKTNEIPVSIQLLKAFDVTGRVITTEVSLLTQRKLRLTKQTLPKSTTAGLKTCTQTPAHTFKPIPTQKTQKARLPHAPSPQAPS